MYTIKKIQIQFFKGAFNNKIALSEKTENIKKIQYFRNGKRYGCENFNFVITWPNGICVKVEKIKHQLQLHSDGVEVYLNRRTWSWQFL